MSSIRENFLRVMERIAKASLRAGRNPDDIKLVAVSKTVDTIKIREAIEAGVMILGENYVQEAQKKIEEIGRNVSWHFIGHLQSNKAKFAVKLFDMIHSIDGFSLAEELNRRAKKEEKVIKVMIEVNLSGETTKFGVSEEGAIELAKKLLGLKNLEIIGLMTMPPYFDNPEMSRPYFVRVRELKDIMIKEGIPLKELSMGMSNDFEIAIEEGATFVRIGTAIFGPRK